MKRFFLILGCMALSLVMATASVDAGSRSNPTGSEANANSQSDSDSASVAGALASLNVYNKYESGGKSTLHNVPAVSAPGVFGGGHPCLAGKSGGIAVAGFGGTYGEGRAETVCMLYVMGQPEAAIRALVMTDKVACEALNNVGYYRIGGSVVPFACGSTVKGGIDTPGATFRTSRVSSKSAPVVGYSKCQKLGNEIRIKYTYGADKAVARQACLSSLGY